MTASDNAPRPMIEHALDYLVRGLPVFPVCSPLMGAHEHRDRTRKRMVPCPPDKWGKTPMTPWKDYQDELPSPDEVRSWWRRWPVANIGMATGRLSGVIVLDCDSAEARQLALERGGLEDAPAVWTGAPGGIHFWIAHPGYEVRNFVKDIPGTDFRGDGGYVLLPPSVHRNHGARYRWHELTLGKQPVPVPDWLEATFRAKASPSASDGPVGDPLDVEEMLRGFDQGNRDNGLFKLACRFRHDDHPLGVAEALIRTAARNCRPPFDEDEAAAKVRYVYDRYEAGNVGPTLEEDGWFSPPTSASASASADPPPAVFLRPISELLAMPEEDPDWLVDQLFTVGSNGWVAAEPKVGKSWIVLELAYALSTGTLFLGKFAIKKQRRVIYVQEEDSLQRVLRRLKKIVNGDKSRGLPPDAYWRWSIRQGFKVDNLAWLEKLRQEIAAFKAEVVILDVFNRLHGSDDSKQQEMTAILNNLTRLSNDYGCAFIIVHHNRKAQQGGEQPRANQMMRGSTVLSGWAECSLYLRKGKEKHVFIVTPESKDASEMDDFSVTLRDLDNGGIILDVGAVSLHDRAEKIDEAVVEAVRKINLDGLDATVQRVADLLKKDRSSAAKRLKSLVEDGILEEDEVQIGRVYVKIYTVVTL